MTDKKIIAAELQHIQTYFEAKADMSIGNGKMKLLSWANAVRDAQELLKEQEPVIPDKPEEVWLCGNCGEIVGWDDWIISTDDVRHKYCPGCGRKVKWDAAD